MIENCWPMASVVYKEKKTGKISVLSFPCVSAEQGLKVAKKLRGGTRKIVSFEIIYKVDL